MWLLPVKYKKLDQSNEPGNLHGKFTSFNFFWGEPFRLFLAPLLLSFFPGLPRWKLMKNQSQRLGKNLNFHFLSCTKQTFFFLFFGRLDVKQLPFAPLLSLHSWGANSSLLITRSLARDPSDGWLGVNQLAGGENLSLLLMATRNPAGTHQLRLVVEIPWSTGF